LARSKLHHVDTLYILMSMTTKLKKWGNSYGIRIPREMLLRHGFKKDGPVQLIDEKNGIKIEPLHKKPTLDELLDQIDPKNIPELIDWGPDVGNEILPEWKE